jgi:phosphotransacetylase
VRNDRIAWGSSMIACKDADAMVTGNIRHYAASIEKLKKVVDPRQGEEIFGMTMMVSKGKTILVADTNVRDFPSANRLAKVSISCVRVARLFGFEPKVATLTHEIETFANLFAEGKSLTLVSATNIVFPFDTIIVMPKISSPCLGSTTFLSFSIEAA